jgi:hypothetical protein
MIAFSLMPKKNIAELTQGEVRVMICAAKVLAALQAYLEDPPPLAQQWYWDDNIGEELVSQQYLGHKSEN